MRRLDVRIDKLEKVAANFPVDMTDQQIESRLQAIRKKLNLPETMDSTEIILCHAPDVLSCIMAKIDGNTKNLVNR